MYRGPDPKAKEIYKLHDQGFKSIISLRTNPERKKERLCKKLGMKWIQIKTGVFKTPTDEQIDQFRALVKDPANQPTYVSCEIDMDRTAIYIAAYRMVDQHWTFDQVNQELHKNHQKQWWPIFRKYQRVIADYAATHQTKELDTKDDGSLGK